jgi:hypothetical protein
MGVFTYAETPANMSSVHFADQICENAGKMEDERASIETRDSTKSPESGPTYAADESQLMMDEMALMGPPTLDRIQTDENQYGPFGVVQNTPYGMVEMVQDRSPNGMPLESMMANSQPAQVSQEAPMPRQDVVVPVEMQNTMPMHASMQQNNSPEVDMSNNMPSPASPNNNNNNMMMYNDQMMQQAMQQVNQMNYMGQQQGIQYVPVPTPVPVQMMPQMVGVTMPMNFAVPGPVSPVNGQMPMQYYMVPQAAEQPREASAPQPSEGGFLESLMPKGWRKRQRPSKRPASRVQKVPSGRKIFVGGLSPNSTAESLIKHFCEFGKISDASVIHEAVSRKSRGFGYVEFADKIPDGLLEMEHFIDQRRCGVRGYNYDPEDTVVAQTAGAA